MAGDMFGDIYTLQRALDGSWVRNKVISNNIANVDTPGYKKEKVEFERYLSQALSTSSVRGTTTNARHIPVGAGGINSFNIDVREDNATSMRLDGNNVDIESEMADLAKNNIMYNALAQQLSKQLSMLRTAIREGK